MGADVALADRVGGAVADRVSGAVADRVSGAVADRVSGALADRDAEPEAGRAAGRAPVGRCAWRPASDADRAAVPGKPAAARCWLVASRWPEPARSAAGAGLGRDGVSDRMALAGRGGLIWTAPVGSGVVPGGSRAPPSTGRSPAPCGGRNAATLA
ncbi:hypothetical protein [Phytohabitans aurantiacus]|uniref:hypothetical protein n=1 Tax=Phytohabitans aurantiacus TaxID=3016789 RepID=UPI0024938CE7|nr:hypothetical protein [Phytohabitans aurantiacus]